MRKVPTAWAAFDDPNYGCRNVAKFDKNIFAFDKNIFI